MRLTLLYGACFIVAGAGLLGITYALFKNGQSQQGSLSFQGLSIQLPKAGSGSNFQVAQVPVGSKKGGTVFVGPPATNKVPAQAVARLNKVLSNQAVSKYGRRAEVVLRQQRAGDSSSLLEYSGIALAVMALLSIFLGWLLAGRALRPLRTMSLRARAITEESLDERLGVDNRDDELGELAVTFDGLLARLERAFESQRRFVANASHELRTPLTLERTLVEVALADPDADAQELRRVCERVVASTEDQERLIDALLTLARGQADTGERDEIDLAATVEDLLTERESRLAGIEVSAELEPALISGDRALIQRLVANLLDNAIVHNGGSGRWIRVRTAADEGRSILQIANGGREVPADQVDDLFEPFHRLGDDRANGHPGLGLGLSIVRAIAVAHGASVSAHALEHGGLELELRFAAQPATACA